MSRDTFTFLHNPRGDLANFAFLQLQIALEEGAHLVELLLADGIRLVFMALGAPQGEPKECTADGGRHFIEHHVAPFAQ